MKNLMILISFVTLLSACGGGAGTGSRATMDNGFEYTMHTNASDKANVSDWVEFDLDLIDPKTDSVIQSMRDPKNRPMIQVPDPVSGPADQLNNPIIMLASMMGPGDSATVYIPIDSVPAPTPEMKDMAEIAYTLIATQVLTTEERTAFMASQQSEQQKLQAAGSVIAEQKGKEALGIYADYKAGKLNAKVKDLGKGLNIVMMEEGSGATPKPGQTVVVHYYGFLANGTMFDNSFKRGTEFSFPIGQGRVIQGWDVGFASMKVGSKALLEIPYDMAYGEAGRPPTIPAKSDLYFYVEMSGIQ